MNTSVFITRSSCPPCEVQGWEVELKLDTDRVNEIYHGFCSQTSERRATRLESPVCDRDSCEVKRLQLSHLIPQQQPLLFAYSVRACVSGLELIEPGLQIMLVKSRHDTEASDQSLDFYVLQGTVLSLYGLLHLLHLHLVKFVPEEGNQWQRCINRAASGSILSTIGR